MAYDERAWYVLTGPEGQQTTSFGDNNYVRQAMEEGIPISVTSKGEWFTRPYVEVTPTGYLTHIPSWFKGTDEYNQWKSIESQAASFSVNKDNFNNINNTLKALGNQGALRYTTYKQTDEVGITDPSLKQFVFDQYLSALNEGANKEAASIQAYGSTDSGQSVAEFAREFKNMSKEDLSKNLVKWEYIINNKNADPVDKANVYTAYRILNLVADNPTDYGDGKEFEGLLEASEWQKFQTHINNVTQTISENFPLVTFGARLGSGLASAMGGQSFADGWQIEKRRDQQYGYLRNETTGAGLRGTEGSAVSGTVAGSVVNMAGTMVEAVAFGTWFNSTALGSSVGAALKGGTSLSTLGGGMVFDFFFNDLPVDLSLFASDLASTGSTQEAWESQSGQTQPLFGVFGPEVPAGMKYNLIGDALMDLTLPVMGIANKAMWNTLDDITGGGVTKLREKVALKNLTVQQKISDMPVIGTGLQKFSNWLFSEENATHIREARKQAIAEGSMTPYIVMQNLLTLSNHYGAEVVAPMYRKLVNDLDINGQIKTFQKNAASYGGIGKVETKWDSYKSGVKKQVYEAIQDDIPRDVKKGLLDYQRLEELKGEREIEGAGLISNPKRDNEIVELEKRVENLAPEIKKFADDFSTLNKQVEQMGVTLGLSTQEWVDALMADPRWKNYMVRQVLLPGGVKATGALDPATNRLLTGKRTGYYNPDQTLSPIMALDMKVHAMGNAYAWNERAKAVVASEISQGKISVGTNGVDIAQKISEKRALIAQSESVKIKLGYDGIVNGFNERMGGLSEVVKKINDQINALDNITVKSVYTNGVAPETKGIIADYNAGKITYADGVIEKAGFSAQDGNAVINNTYRVGTNVQTTPKQTPPSVSTTPRKIPVTDGNYAPAMSSEDFRTKYGIDARRGLSLGSIDNEGDALTLLKDKIDANGGFTSQRDIDVVLNKFPGAKTEYKKIQGELEPGYTRDDVITELYNRRVAEPQGLEKRLTKEEWDWVEYQRKWGGDEKVDNLIVGTTAGEMSDSARKIIDSVVSAKTRHVGGEDTIEIIRAELGRDVAERVTDKLDERGFFRAYQNGDLTDSEYYERVRGIYQESLLEMLNDEEKSLLGGIDEVAADIAAPAKYAGITSSGVPYEYTIENNKITSMEKITDPEGLAESVSGMGIGFSLGEEEIKAIGVDNVAAINKAQLAYRDNNMAIPGTNTRVRVYEAPDGSSDGATLGFNYPSPEYHIENGKVVGTNEIYLNTNYYGEGRNTHRIETAKKEVKEGFFVRNTEGPEYTPIHENAHALTKQIAVEEFNEKISSGRISLDRVEALSHSDSNLTYTTVDGQKKYLTSLEEELYTETLRVEDEIISGAMKRVYPDIDSAFSTTFLEKEVARNSKYPLTLQGTPAYNSEIIAAAMEDYFANGSDANVLSVAIAAEVSDKLQKHQMAVSPKVTLQENSLQIPKGLLKGDEYAFPASVKTQVEKAEWLDKWRQKNPYIKGELDADTFQKANLWDSYFQKEIRAYNSDSTSSAPDALLEKSGRFVEQERARAAKEITAEIKRLSGGEFDSDLAMIIMGKNGEDIYKAMNNYIIRQVDISAEELAKNMEGGLTAENLNTARVTLWSDSNTKESVTSMLEGLVPDSGENVASMVDALFDKQSKGLAAYDALPVDAKALIEEKDKLVQQLYKENKAAIKDAEAMDKNSAFRDGGSHIIHYKEGGEDVYLSVSDPVIGSMFEKPYDFKEHGMVAETMTTVANFMATTYRLGTTGMNPMAFIRNVLRDPIQAFATAGTNPLGISLSPEAFYKSLRQYGLDNDTIATVSQRIRSWAQSGTMTEEMRLGPGRGPSTYRNNMEYVSNRLKDATNGKIVRTLQAPLETWEGFFRNQVGQQSFVKNYRRTGDVDKALASALFDTSNATTNFSHAIGKWKWATSTVPYLSSAINGTVSFWRLFNVDPVGMVTRITAGFMVPVMAITAWNLSNEDNRRAYETLPEWFKQGHLVMTDGNGNILAFPLPEEIQQFAGTARKLIEFTQEASPYSLATIAAQGAFGFLPFEVDGFWGDDGSLQLKEGAFQMVSGLIPQAATTLYELIWQQDLFTGEDLSTYNGLNTTINTLSNIFGTGIKQVVNSIGIMAGASEKDLVGKSLQDTIARDLFGMGFDAAKNQFMAIVGSPAKLQENGTMTKATGLFEKNEELKRKIDALSSKIAVSSDAEKAGLEEQKQTLINEFTDRVKNAMDKYQRMFSLTGGLEMWQKNRLVQLLTLGDAWSSGEYTSYQAESASEAYLNERGLAQQRYVQAGLPAGPDLQNLVGTNSIEIQAALNSFYGAPKQAATDYRNAIDSAGVKKIRNEFYNAISQIYDAADAQGKKPDYDLIEKIQARYLQSVDAVLVPIINQYGINILNNSDFIDAVRKQVNGMIPSDDWKQSTKNTKKFLSSKEFPTTTVDVKKWLIQRYSSGMKNRNIGSDQIVVDKLAEIKADLDAGRRGSAQSKINSLRNGIDKANYYISSQDFQTLTQYNNMLK